ncbi:MAG: type II secretion system protein GspD [Thermoguttaceae bacterium]
MHARKAQAGVRETPGRGSCVAWGTLRVLGAALTIAARAGLAQEDAPADAPARPPAAAAQQNRPGQEPAPGGPLSPGSPLRTMLPKLAPGQSAPASGPIRIPLAGSPAAERLEIKQSDGLVSLVVRNVPVNSVLMALAQKQNLNIVCAENATAPVSVTLERVPLEYALNSIVSVAGCSWVQKNGIIYVTSVSAPGKLAAELQGRQVRVFRLDFASATDVEGAIKAMLSPVGKSFTILSRPSDNRKTEELVVVEDLPAYLRVIEDYIEQVDQPPRQVLIEAHVLSVNLQRDDNWGVNFQALIEQLGKAGGFQVRGFANPLAAQAFFFSVDRGDLDLLLEALATQTDAKTLAAPKVLVLNGQEARIQVGQQLGFRVTTTTETSTLENVNFLDVGVVLRVTPRVTRNDQVLMSVRPEVSTGRVSPVTGLPESDTTHVETNVMLPNGQGMVIGGLIQEKDTDTQQKVPVLGDLWLVGRIFQRRELRKQRQEIIIALVPRVIPAPLACDDRHATEVLRTQTPLLEGPLDRVHRPWEAVLPDAVQRPFRLEDVPAVDKCLRKRQGEPAPAAIYAEPYYAGERQPCPPGLYRPASLPEQTEWPLSDPGPEDRRASAEEAPFPPGHSEGL